MTAVSAASRRPPEQITRNLDELLQELRVLQTGVQILTGFLLTVPFSNRFPDLADHQRALYLAVLSGAVLTTALIVAPVAFHRLLFRQHERPWLVAAAHRCARAGLGLFALVTAGVLGLVFDVVAGSVAGAVAAAVAVVVLGGLWFALAPLEVRHSERAG